MGILDDAIKEHLDLKRQHGAGDDELKKLEDEVFGASERPGQPDSAPDPYAEAPTEFMAQPDLGEAAEAEEPAEAPRPRPDVADLQEAPPPAPEPDEPPAEEEAPAIEQAIPEPAAEPSPDIPAGPSTEEREAIAEQPTEMYDIEDELGGSDAAAPSEEELVEEEMQEPRLAPVDPLSGVADDEEDEDEDEQDADDFFDEKRLSDELDQALEAPLPDDEELEDEEEPEDEQAPAEDDEEDVLEETPDFLEEAPEDDQLWFEQKPPKDFDFDD